MREPMTSRRRGASWFVIGTLAVLGLGAALFLSARPAEDRPPEGPDAARTEADGRHGGARLTPTDDHALSTEATAAGSPFVLRLTEPPRAYYGHEQWTEADRAYAAEIADDATLHYDPALGQAARELAVFYSQHGRGPPTEAFQFLLASAGAPEWGVLQAFLRTTSLDKRVVRQRVAALSAGLADAGEGIRVGIGESYALGRHTERVVAVLVSRGGLYLTPVPRRVAAGGRLTLGGVVPRGATEVRLAAWTPDGRFHDVAAALKDGAISATVGMPAQPGLAFVELIAGFPSGPAPLAQLEIHVGQPVATSFSGNFPPAEDTITTDSAAEQLIYRLIARDRAHLNVPPLTRHSALAAAARVHSREMRDTGSFTHRSAHTGNVADRLKAQGYAVRVAAENIAGNRSLHDAQAGLMYSLGHRRNLLRDDVTHVGVGVAHSGEGSQRLWIITQVFASPQTP